MSLLAPGVADEAQNFQRDHWQHTRHHIQNQSAQERIKKRRPKRRRALASHGSIGRGNYWQFDIIGQSLSSGVLHEHSGNLFWPISFKFLDLCALPQTHSVPNSFPSTFVLISQGLAVKSVASFNGTRSTTSFS